MNIFRLFILSAFISFVWYFYQSSEQHNYYILFVIMTGTTALIFQIKTVYQKKYYFGFIKQLRDLRAWSYPAIILLRWLLLILLFVTYKEIMVTAQVTEAVYMKELDYFGAFLLVVGIMGIFVTKKIDPIMNTCLFVVCLIFGFEIYKGYQSPPLEQSVTLAAPFKKTFYIATGGESRLHSNAKTSKRKSRSYLLQLFVTDKKFAQTPRGSWTDYPHTFGEPIYAPAEGTVIEINNSYVDAGFNDLDTQGGPGNFIFIKIADDQFLVLGHLQQDSILVRKGDTVKEGQPIARCGKSGQTTEATLALCVFNRPDFFSSETRSYPIYFKNVKRRDAEDSGLIHFAKRNLFLIPTN